MHLSHHALIFFMGDVSPCLVVHVRRRIMMRSYRQHGMLQGHRCYALHLIILPPTQTTRLYQFEWSPVRLHDIIDMHMYYDSRNKLRCITTMMKRSHARQHVHKHSDSRDIFTSIIRAYTHDENIKCTVTVMAYLHARHPSPKG